MNKQNPKNQKANVNNSNNRPPHGNNAEYKGKIDNRANQLNPNHSEFKGKK